MRFAVKPIRAALLIAVVMVAAIAASQPTKAQAQVNNNAFVRNYIFNQPTVSPYLNLLRRDGLASPNYQTLVRPQIQFRQAAELQQVEMQRMQQQLNVQRASLDAIRQQQAQRVFSTGHQTRFLNTGSFYPGFSQPAPALR